MISKLDKLLKESKRLAIDDKTKLVIMSDCHRGSGDGRDNFIRNQNIFVAALEYYYKNEFIYVELGDGDDMWEVINYKDIIEEHIRLFKLLKKFNDAKRLIMLYGNHDICKKSETVLKDNFYEYYNKVTKKNEKLLDNLEVIESLVLDYQNHDIFLLHGHQVDLLNGKLWRFSRFLVRHIWRHLERITLKDPTSAAKNYQVSKRVEKKLKKWSIKNNKIVISGHTHRPIFPVVGESLYFNDGSCVHPNGITCLEIEYGNITLVKWLYDLEDAKLISVKKVVVTRTEAINNFYL